MEKKSCPYIGTIKREVLDFDFEKICPISLSNINVYACLICGKYYQGRGLDTYAYIHSMEQDHHIFINLSNQKVYCLPDGYEIYDNSINDIKFNLKPKIDISLVDKFSYSRALDGTEFLPGCIGLNNIKKTDYVNVIIQGLCRVKEFRNFLLEYDDDKLDIKFDLVGLFLQRLAELMRKIWNPKNFKSHVSPHEVMQAITLASNGKFKIIEQSDSINFLSWILNTIHNYLCKKFKKKTSIISEAFQGELIVEKFTLYKEKENEDRNLQLIEMDGMIYKYEKTFQQFFFLNLDLPRIPLYKDSNEKVNIPQVSIYQLFKKYDSETFKDDLIKGIKTKYHLKRLPKNLILYYKRFEKNLFFTEKNTTIVNFPIKNVSLKEFCGDNTLNRELKYNLLANVIHDGDAKAGNFKVQVKNKNLDKWYDIQDLYVNEIMAQSVVVSESYIHIYEGVE